MTARCKVVSRPQPKYTAGGCRAGGYAYLPYHMPRRGFSLLEVMLATAILASSALVLSSLLGLGVKFGLRAETRTESIAQAQSLLDEFLALAPQQSEPAQEKTGVINSTPPRRYRIRAVEAMTNIFNANGSGGASDTASAGSLSGGGEGLSTSQASVSAYQPFSRLLLVTVEVFESTAENTDLPPLSKLVKLVRLSAELPSHTSL